MMLSPEAFKVANETKTFPLLRLQYSIASTKPWMCIESGRKMPKNH